MKNKSNFFNKLVTFFVVLSLSGQSVAFAQTPQQQDNVRIGYNDATGKVSFIGADPSKPITIRSAQVQGLTADSSARAMIAPYAADFGLKNPVSELKLISADQVQGREVTRFQQVYKGIPIMGGEMIVNSTDEAELLSLSGEISPDLVLDINPSISPKQAQITALESTAKSHQASVDVFETTEPELWIYDSRLLEPDGRKATLVWRLEVKSKDNTLPINELVLVDAKRGAIVLNFNQIDTAWATGNAGAIVNPSAPNQDNPPTDIPTVTPIPEVTITPVAENTEISDATPIPAVTATPIVPIVPIQPHEGQNLAQETATTYYVDIAAGNDGNSCTSVAAPCQHIQQAVEKGSTAGDTIYVASGTYMWSNSTLHPNYKNVIIIDRSITLLGGWNTSFTIQDGVSMIDGANTNNGILVGAGASTTLVENFIIQNATSYNGGALYITNGNFTLQNSTLKNSSAPANGGGIYAYGGTITVLNSTISGNTAIQGAGISLYNSSSAIIQNSTIVFNNASWLGGGIARSSPANIVTVKNSIVAFNTSAGTAHPDCNQINTSSYNIIGDTTGCVVTAGAGDQFNVNPQISNTLSDPGQVHALLAGSPAINAGTSVGCPATDQRGVPRPQGSKCDIGAYEYYVVGAPNSVKVQSGSVQVALLSSSFADSFAAIVKDEQGLPMSGITITFSAPASGASGTFADTSNNITTAITNINGIATAPAFTANGVAGSYIVVAAVSGVALPAEFQLENHVQTATSITIDSGSQQSVLINTTYGNPLKVLVKDQFANPMQGVTVTFTAPTSGASGTFSISSTNETTVVTGINGTATASDFTANGTAGAFTVDSSVAGLAAPAIFQLSNMSGLYVSPTGVDGATCDSSAAPCQTINHAISKATTGQFILVAQGTYTSTCSSCYVITVNKSLTLSGGWNSLFDTQNSFSIVDGEGARGGISTSSGITVSINNFVIQNGYASQGGGIRNQSPSLTINNSTIKNNRSTQDGGGIYSSGNLILNNVTISNNTAGMIAGFGFGGGGVYQGANSLTVQNSTVVNNKINGSSGPGVGAAGIYDRTTGTITVRNSIISNCSGTINISDHNLVSNTSGCTLASSTGDSLNIDPLLAPMSSSPGLHYLAPGSPAIDAGSPETPGSSASACAQTDQLGRVRPIDGDNDGNARCDIGAYESDIPAPSVISSVGVFSGSPQIVKMLYSSSSPLIAIVKDQYDLPKPGVLVTFTAPGSGASGKFSDTLTNTTTAITDAGGKATAPTFTANSIVGSYVVNATVSGIASPAQFQLENQVAVPTAITVSGGSGQSTYLNFDFTNPISALVKDQFGNPMQGITVTFTAPAAGATSVFNDTGTHIATAVTNSSGIATSLTLSANGTGGTYSVNATASGVTAPAVFQMTNSVVICAIFNQTNYSGILFKPYKEFKCANSSSLSYGIGSGDFNNDGRQDIALSQEKEVGQQHMLLIFLQGVDGSYPANPISYPDGNRSEYLAVGDLNNDGRMDVATADFSDDTISVFLQQINGTLAKRATYSTGNGPDAIAIDDVNNDGLDDVVVSHWNSATIGVFTQKAAGTLNSITTYPSISAGYDDIAIGDVNNDGRNDVVKMNGQGLNPNILVYTQSVNGSLGSSVAYTLGCNCLGHGVDIGDVTGDGRDDVVMSYGGNRPDSYIAVFPQALDGSLQTPVSYNAYDIPEPVEIADANSDGKMDVITAHGGWSKIGILPQNNNGQLGSYSLLQVPYKSHYYRQDLSVGDLNNDTLPDILVAGIQGPIIIYRQAFPDMGGARQTYTASNTTSLPGDLLCDETSPLCTNGSNIDADYAHVYAGQAWVFYNDHHNRSSIDNQDMIIVSSVHYGSGYQNAYWSGTQMVYGDGYTIADDIVAHELTHGVTQYESDLFYYYQSGAINESFSDVWGELFDQQNGLDGAQPGMKWYIGEDLPGGAIRNMSNPPAYGDPDKMTSANYYSTSGDDGGVHHNSGINNKAAYLMVNGGSFNGKTVTAIGAVKTLAIYYEVQTNLLTSGADYSDLYNALFQGCLNLVGGASGIVSNDCQQVRNATDAVEMNLQPVAISHTESSLCSVAGQTPNNTFYDDLESGTSNWTIVNGGTTRWQSGSPYGVYAHSGTNFLFADDYPAVMSDTYVRLKPITIPANGYLNFAHAYDFEKYSTDLNYYDGGVLEYSMNGGTTWLDAGPLIGVNGYVGTISTAYNNPLKGRSAFVGTSHGYISTRLNLSSLAGKSVTFRWRMGLDDGGSRWGWWLDDVQVYACATARPYVVSSVPASANPTNATNVNLTVTFSDPVTGVSTSAPFSDFILTTTGITGASITSVSGTGATRTVAVNTGTGNGTIRLDVLDNDNILDGTGNKLGGTGLRNGDYISGGTYMIDKTVPTVSSITRVGSNPAASASVSFNVTFSEPVSAVDLGDFTFNSTEVVGASISSVSGSGATRVVQVKTGTGDGTIRLNLVDDNTIIDSASNPLGGAGAGNGNFSGETYTIDKPDLRAPILRSPRSKVLLKNNLPSFWWTGVQGAQNYEIQFAEDSLFTVNVDGELVNGSPYTVSIPLSDATYYWRVRAYNVSDQPGTWSSYRILTIDTTAPPTPVLSSPASNFSTRRIPIFRWQLVNTAVAYQFQYDNSSGFTSPNYSVTTRGNFRRPPVMKVGTYYWRVRAKDAAGNWGAWSTPFTINITDP